MKGIGSMDKNTIIKLFEASVVKEKFIFPPEYDNLKRSIVEDFCAFCKEKLGIEEMPEIRLVNDWEPGMSTGAFTPSPINKIKVLCGGRLLLDVLRSIGHELTHRWQDEQGILKDIPKQGKRDSSDESDIEVDFENVANSKAGELVKRFSRQYGKVKYEDFFDI